MTFLVAALIQTEPEALESCSTSKAGEDKKSLHEFKMEKGFHLVAGFVCCSWFMLSC